MKVTAFDTLDEMMEAIDENRRAADSQVKPWQAAVKPGDYFVQTTPYDFLIFGHVLKPHARFYKTEQGRHYRFCKCFSVVCEDGEMGDVHVSQIALIISEETFLRYREKGWVVEDGDEL